MEIRTLEYFCAAADEGSITNAANALHVTQPTLSRQISQLEQELGQTLFLRSHGGVELTERGTILYRHARNILDLAAKAEEEVGTSSASISGVVHIGAGETKAMGILARAMKAVRAKYPAVSFDIHDGTTADLMEQLVKGFIDILLECDLQPHSNLNSLELPISDVWGVVTRSDSPLAKKDTITAKDLEGQPIIASTQGLGRTFGKWAKDSLDHMNIVATYGLPLNSIFLVEEGYGNLLTYGGLVGEQRSSNLCFRELSPRLEARHGLLWRKTMPTRQTQAFLDELQKLCQPKTKSSELA